MINIHTLGCRLNIQESEHMKDLAQDFGLNNIVIINTCAVTEEAQRKSRQAIRKMKKKYPDSKIIVTGCAATIAPEEFHNMPETDILISNEQKIKKEIWQKIADSSPKEIPVHFLNALSHKNRAFVQVQNGCDHFCTFCIIPYARQNSRSIPSNEVINIIKKHIQLGRQEIVLTGVDLTDYNEGLGFLVQKILQEVPDLRRLRISSLDCIEIDDALLDVFSDSRVMPHVHLSLQSGNNLILKRMKRRYLRDDILIVCHNLRRIRPDIVFGADFIAGFPTETEEMFLQTMQLVEECDISFLHVFVYSKRIGTPAARMPQVPIHIRKERARLLRCLGEKKRTELYKNFIGKKVSALLEHITSDEVCMGHTDHFIPIFVKEKKEIGNIISVQVQEMKQIGLFGCLV